MRIVRGHDYYDSALAYGQDDDITFVRETKFIADEDAPIDASCVTHELVAHNTRRSYIHHNSEVWIKDRAITNKYPIYSITVYFCNKRYQGFGCDIGTEKHVFWTKAALVQWLIDMGQVPNTEAPHPTAYWRYNNANPVSLEAYFTPREITNTERDWMIDNKIAIAIWSGDKQVPYSIEGWEYYKQGRHGSYAVGSPWRCNSADAGHALKEYKFMKVLDPYTAMQELSMWVGGVLPKDGPDMVTITDEKTLVRKHGFDKWSFRKHKDDVK